MARQIDLLSGLCKCPDCVYDRKKKEQKFKCVDCGKIKSGNYFFIPRQKNNHGPVCETCNNQYGSGYD